MTIPAVRQVVAKKQVVWSHTPWVVALMKHLFAVGYVSEMEQPTGSVRSDLSGANANADESIPIGIDASRPLPATQATGRNLDALPEARREIGGPSLSNQKHRGREILHELRYMPRLALMSILLLCGTMQAAIFQNTFTTNQNSMGTGALVSQSNNLLGVNNTDTNTFLRSGGVGSAPSFVALPGSSATNPIANIYVTNLFATNITVQNNLTVSNLFTVNGNHNTLIVTNSLTLQTIKTNVLATTSSGLITNVNYGSGLTWTPSTLTLSASGGGGASVWIPNAALTYSGGTNVTIDGSGGTNFYVLLTNTAFFATPSNIPASSTTNTSFTVFFQQNATGTWDVTWTNASFKWPGGSQFKPLTNASSVSWVTFTMSPFTNGIFVGDYGVLDSR
ncbi:MAG: hypothetical protein V4563_14490 [Pseudomonadota bacterium]